MRNSFLRKENYLGRVLLLFSVVVSSGFLVYRAFFVEAATFIPLTSQASFGESSANVSNLQTFLAADRNIYPEGLVTGYYGSLTRAAVMRFQNKYGIDPVGSVGPITLNKINGLISSGEWALTVDISGPAFRSVNSAVSSNGATFNWNTDELATAKIFYNIAPVTMNEGDINSVGFGATNGSVATNDGLARTSQQVFLTGLQPNTTYHYVVVATDLKGNVSVWNPNTTFTTSP
jgi:hypothetical protein